MTHAENNTRIEIRTAGPRAARTTEVPNGAAAVIVSGPSCPAAFARWWAEYQEKVMKAFPAQKSVFALEGRQ